MCGYGSGDVVIEVGDKRVGGVDGAKQVSLLNEGEMIP